jgi:hypothetical protein
MKQVSKTVIIDTETRIDVSDQTNRARAAQYRCDQRLRALDSEYETKASEIRSAYIAELAEICGLE